ncbi:unnamed protein product [Sphagnum balticum]
MKSHRKQQHRELLSAQDKSDVEKSAFVLANPTHIAIGIYVNLEITPLPFVSFVEKGEKAFALIQYAEKCGTPVVRDIAVARRLFKSARQYSFITLEMLEPIFRILVWLHEINVARGTAHEKPLLPVADTTDNSTP